MIAFRSLSMLAVAIAIVSLNVSAQGIAPFAPPTSKVTRLSQNISQGASLPLNKDYI
jgi:hypothetical protein